MSATWSNILSSALFFMGSKLYNKKDFHEPRQFDIRIGQIKTEIVERKKKTDKEKRLPLLVGFSMLGQLGLAIVIPIVVGVVGGYWIDQHIVHNRITTLIGMGIGIIISLINAIATIQTIRSFSKK